MSRYIMLIYSDVERWAEADPEFLTGLHGEYATYTQGLIDSGAWVGGDPLEGVETAKTVNRGGVVTDGPFADITEHLGGYYVVEAESIDAATKLAAGLPGVDRGLDRIEVRPIRPFELEAG